MCQFNHKTDGTPA